MRRASLLVLLGLSAFAPAVARDDASRAMAGKLLPAASFGETRPLEQDGRAWSQWRGPEPVSASPAIANSRIYIRGDRHLFAIGEKIRCVRVSV